MTEESALRSLPSYGTLMRHLEAWLTVDDQLVDVDEADEPRLATLLEDLTLWRAAGKPEEAAYRRQGDA